MQQQYFVHKNSVVRKIWGSADIVLFIFAGAAAEFAVNKSVDWLYFTGKLPQDPLGRFFSTVNYAKNIVFSTTEQANKQIDTIAHIHAAVEAQRGASIPDWAYRDVLFMLIHYSIACHQLFERPLTDAEKEEVYNVFYRMGTRMGLTELPSNYIDWLPAREAHMAQNLQPSKYTAHLYAQYRKHLGPVRYRVLLEGQKLVVPQRVRQLLGLSRHSLLTPALPVYKATKLIKMDRLLKHLLLPPAYKEQINKLDVARA